MTYRQPGFQKRLEELIPVGSSASPYQALFERADTVRKATAVTIYRYDQGNSLSGGQGLMVSIWVGAFDNTIKKVHWNIAGK
jgi:hypothetical protein